MLILEGIHALNPLLTKDIPQEAKFKIYASALTSILLDDHNYIPTTDNRLLRRIVRDYKYRGYSAEDTIRLVAKTNSFIIQMGRTRTDRERQMVYATPLPDSTPV